jgi:hypothetical protein
VALEPLFLRESFRDASLSGVPLLAGIAVMLVGIVVLARTRHVSALAAGPGVGARPPGEASVERPDGAVPSSP